MAKVTNTPGKWKQMIAAIIINLGVLTVGMAYGWTSAVTKTFQDVNNTLEIEQMTENDTSWLSSTLALSLLLILPFSSSLCERFGRKNIAIVEAIGYMITWLLRLFATNFYVLLAAQLLTGICDGLSSVIIPLYVTEIASDSIRGQLGTMYMLAYKGGYLSAFILAAVLPYKIVTGCALIPPAIHLGGLLFLPETPVYLIRKGRPDEAKKSLMWLRGNDEAVAECEQLKIEEFYRKIMKSKTSLSIKDLFTDHANFKSFMILLAMVTIQEMTGTSIMMMYIVKIIDQVKSPIDPYIASIIYGSAQLSGCWLSILTVDRYGRRPLLLLSCSTMAVAHCIIGVFFSLQSLGYCVAGYGWVPVAAVTLFGFSYTSGVGPLAIVVSNEVFNPELASICNSIFLIGYSIIAFALLKLFPVIASAIGFHNCFFILMCTCTAGFFVILFTIPETKGRSIESIRDELQGVDTKTTSAVEDISSN